MTFTVTPQPWNEPPRVRIDVDSDDVGGSFTSLAVMRDGRLVREQPFVGSPVAVVYDYEAPFGRPATYSAQGSFLPAVDPDWTEVWANLTNWTGSGFTVSGGKARSTVTGAQIVRGATGAIERLSVADPSFVRIELVDAANVVVASIQVGTSVAVSGIGTSVVNGTGSFSATLTAGVMSVSAANSSWSASETYVGTPTKVRIVSLGVSYPASSSFVSVGQPRALALDSAGNIYVADFANSMIRKFAPSGTAVTSFSTTGKPTGVAVDSSGNIYVTDVTNKLLRKFNASGTQTLSFSTTGAALSVALDAAGNIYVGDYTSNRVRKYAAGGTETLSFPTTGVPTGLAVDGSGNVFVADDDYELVRKFNSSGTQTLSFGGAGDPRAVAVDASGFILVADGEPGANLIRRFDSTGTQVGSFSTTGQPVGVVLDSAGNPVVVDYSTYMIRSFTATSPSVGAIVETPAAAPMPFNSTATTTLNVPDAWLIHPSKPALSVPIEMGETGTGVRFIEASSGEQKTSAAVATVHRAVGRARAVVITSGPRQADEWTLVIGAETIVAKNAVRSIVDDQTPLLIRSHPDMNMDLPDDWYSVGDFTVNRVETPIITEMTLMSLPLTPVDEPVVRQGALWSWSNVLTSYATWADVLADNDTWLDVLAGPS